jgi:hypothetical protein
MISPYSQLSSFSVLHKAGPDTEELLSTSFVFELDELTKEDEEELCAFREELDSSAFADVESSQARRVSSAKATVKRRNIFFT